MADTTNAPQAKPKDYWKIRRRIVLATLLYCAIHFSWLVFRGSDTALHQQEAIALAGLAGAVIGSYVFGAVWHDVAFHKDP